MYFLDNVCLEVVDITMMDAAKKEEKPSEVSSLLLNRQKVIKEVA